MPIDKNVSSYKNFTYAHLVTAHPENKQFDRHCHKNYEILYVLQGEGTYQIEGAEYPIKPNTLLLIRPYEFHFFRPQRQCLYERYVINFDADALIDAAASLSFLQSDKSQRFGALFSLNHISGQIRDAFDEIEFAMQHFADGNKSVSREETFVRLQLSRILLLLSTECPHDVAVPEKSVVAQVMEYLNMNLRSNLSLDDIAQHFFISKYYLCHTFRAYTGVSILTYINKKRIAMAQQLIEEGEPAASVSEQVGFGSYPSFYRTYCKITGTPPSHRRQKNTKESEKNEMKIRKARYEDLEALLEIYAGARAFMRENGNPDQWGDSYPSRELITNDIQEGCCYVCELQGEPVGVFYYKEGSDPTYASIYEGEWLNREPYAVIHRIAVAAHCRGVASFCFEHCYAICPNIRIDTHRNNLPMQRSLAKNGFTRCGIIYLEDGSERIAYQKA